VKVGGRRLSLSSSTKAKTSSHGTDHHDLTNEASVPSVVDEAEQTDYPRPSHRTEDADAPDDSPKKTGYRGMGPESTKRAKEHDYRSDDKRPKNENLSARKSIGGAGRIAQPAGKPLGE